MLGSGSKKSRCCTTWRRSDEDPAPIAPEAQPAKVVDTTPAARPGDDNGGGFGPALTTLVATYGPEPMTRLGAVSLRKN